MHTNTHVYACMYMYTNGIHLMSVMHSSQRETEKFAQNMSGILISFVGQRASSAGKDTAAKPDNLCSTPHSGEREPTPQVVL